MDTIQHEEKMSAGRQLLYGFAIGCLLGISLYLLGFFDLPQEIQPLTVENVMSEKEEIIYRAQARILAEELARAFKNRKIGDF